MLHTPGNRFLGGTATQHSSVVDENYMIVGAHVDSATNEKIRKGEYVDFSHLLPKEKLDRDEAKLELVHRAGQTYFIPAERDSGNSITSFHKWEQAFRVFSNLYCLEHPDRSTELIQYNHVIFSASLTYTWDNVYTYDCEFRMHLGSFPERSWAIILQQAGPCISKTETISWGPGKQWPA